jgi:hypothetical protein
VRELDLSPTPWRVVVGVLVVALGCNVALAWITTADDVFANLIAAASGLVAVALVVTSLQAYKRWKEEALLAAMVVWLANGIEFALTDGPSAQSKIRQVGFYAAFALLALGAHVILRLHREAAEAS